MRRRARAVWLGLLLVPLAADAQPPETWSPPRFISGRLPDTPVQVVGGGEVVLEAELDSGRVRDLVVVRATPPFTDAVVDAVRGWQFRALDGSRVLVVYVARPPTLIGPTLGAAPVDVGAASPEVAYPAAIAAPEYPPRASGEGVVLVEIAVDGTGRVTDTTVLQSAGAFDDAALDAVRRWRFQPARIAGEPEATSVYAVFAFRPPVAAPAIPR